MSFTPSQGFRHAATLLLTNGVRAIPADASPTTLHTMLERLAHELVCLADDMRAPAEATGWLIAEFAATIDRLPHSFDRERATSAAAATLARVASRTLDMESRDLFLVYVPEDRLSVAAPLAVELAKRRVSVAIAEYEVATGPQCVSAIASGLTLHRAGAVLWTRAFRRPQWALDLSEHGRLRILRSPSHESTAADLAEWVRRLRVSKP